MTRSIDDFSAFLRTATATAHAAKKKMPKRTDDKRWPDIEFKELCDDVLGDVGSLFSGIDMFDPLASGSYGYEECMLERVRSLPCMARLDVIRFLLDAAKEQAKLFDEELKRDMKTSPCSTARKARGR